jgi:hypothetical protein
MIKVSSIHSMPSQSINWSLKSDMEHEEERGGSSKEEAQDKCCTDPSAERYDQIISCILATFTDRYICFSGRKT